MNRSALATFSLATAIAVMSLGYASPSFADPPGSGGHNHGGTSSGDGAEFKVVINGYHDYGSGPELIMTGRSAELTPWAEFGGKNGIGLNDASGADVGTLTGVGGFFSSGSDPDYQACFNDSGTVGGEETHDFSPQLHQAIIKSGKKGRAEAYFWFHGETHSPLVDGDSINVRVLYLLTLIGKFDELAETWPSAQTLTMTSWELKVENEGKTIKGMSCQGAGPTDVTIEVVDTS